MAKSMGYNQASGVSGMLKSGHQTYEGTYGAVLKNIEAGKSMASMVGVLVICIYCPCHCNKPRTLLHSCRHMLYHKYVLF